jgi:hypothetical protein
MIAAVANSSFFILLSFVTIARDRHRWQNPKLLGYFETLTREQESAFLGGSLNEWLRTA